MSAIPKELEEAARIDGANEWQIFFHVILPLVKPALGTVVTFGFIMIWDQYLLPLIRPLARTSIVLIQLLKLLVPRNWSHSKLLHRTLAFSMNRFVSPEANWFILRHFHLGSQVLAFVAANSPAPVSTSPLTPTLTVGGMLSKQEIASLFACTLPARSVMDTWIVAFSRSSTA